MIGGGQLCAGREVFQIQLPLLSYTVSNVAFTLCSKISKVVVVLCGLFTNYISSDIQKVSVSDMERMLLLGHSFVHRLDAFMKATDRVNFEFDECRTTCGVFGIGGLRIDGVFSPRKMDKVATFRPGLLIIEIGTNDIDASCVTVEELAKTVFRFAKLCLSDYAVCKVIFCPVLPRGPVRFQAWSVCFESNRVALNEALAALCTSDSRVSMLTHQRFPNVAELLRDGVHLSDGPGSETVLLLVEKRHCGSFEGVTGIK